MSNAAILQPDAFAGLGLIVFDECHLLHPREEDRSRRGLDAMLAILNLTLCRAHRRPASAISDDEEYQRRRRTGLSR